MISSSSALTEIMLTCSRSLLFFLRCIFFVASLASLSLSRLSRLLLLLLSRLWRWRLNSRFLINISISACFDKCWRMINHNDQVIWCCRCVRRLSAATIYTCRAFIERARKCEYCFMRKHDCVMNSASRHFQLSMRRAALMMTHRFNACIKTRLALRLWQ